MILCYVLFSYHMLYITFLFQSISKIINNYFNDNTTLVAVLSSLKTRMRDSINKRFYNPLHSFLKIKSGSLSQDGLKTEKDYAIFLCLFFAILSNYEKVRKESEYNVYKGSPQ